MENTDYTEDTVGYVARAYGPSINIEKYKGIRAMFSEATLDEKAALIEYLVGERAKGALPDRARYEVRFTIRPALLQEIFGRPGMINYPPEQLRALLAVAGFVVTPETQDK